MVVTFPFAFDGKETPEHVEYGNIFVAVTRKNLPNAIVVQMADMTTKAIGNVDSVYRTPAGLAPEGASIHKAAPGIAFAEWYFDAMINFPSEEFVRLDYDVMVRGDISDVFEHPFDIAIAKEDKGRMNNGVVFVKNKAFFSEAKRAYLDTQKDNWQDVQTAMQVTIDTGYFRVRKLPQTYNQLFDPAKPFPADTKLLHFKGSRKNELVGYPR